MSTDNKSLGDVLFGGTRGGVLALLYGRTDQSFYTRQIARDVEASVGASRFWLHPAKTLSEITPGITELFLNWEITRMRPV